MTIIRPQTEAEKDLTPIGPDGDTIGFIQIGTKTAEDIFLKELQLHEKNCTKEGKPFASAIAKIEWEDHYKEQAKLSMRRNGYVRLEDIKPIKVDWERYSDLKNFEEIESGERVDDYLTKVNPGLLVKVKFKKYRFKGFSNTYRVMEDGPSAINRATFARKKLMD